jgi:polysaccharide deacetylase family protein (PEP-CTERM system associated)
VRSRLQAGVDVSASAPPTRAVRHAFTVDVEDWYQAIPISTETRASADRRMEYSLGRLLEILDEAKVRGTFFWLGPAAEAYPELLRRTAAAGHEIGCHGWSHDLLYMMGPDRFREETRRATEVIEDIVGRPVPTYRAAYFSITQRSLWALEVLVELGYRYDSSIFPVRNWRYGIPDFPPEPRQIATPAGPIHEFPLSVRRIMGRNVPVSGGAYFRLYPYAMTRSNFRAAEADGRPTVFYLHPWELDASHPRVSFHWKAWLTHYANLGSTEPKLRRMLREFRFATLSEAWDDTNAGSRSEAL